MRQTAEKQEEKKQEETGRRYQGSQKLQDNLPNARPRKGAAEEEQKKVVRPPLAPSRTERLQEGYVRETVIIPEEDYWMVRDIAHNTGFLIRDVWQHALNLLRDNMPDHLLEPAELEDNNEPDWEQITKRK